VAVNQLLAATSPHMAPMTAPVQLEGINHILSDETLSELRPPVKGAAANKTVSGYQHKAGSSVTVLDPAEIEGSALPLVVNWHLEPRCNYGCKFCFATFEDIPGAEVVRDPDTLLLVSELRAGPPPASQHSMTFGLKMLHEKVYS
jgi:hypothetical protein